MATQDKIRVTSIGHIAHQALMRQPAGFVTGTTSQGIFLQLYEDLTLFLTRDPFRGPLTINIRDESGGFASIQPEDTAEFAEDTITFSDSGQMIGLDKPLIWKPASPPKLSRQSTAEYTQIVGQVQAITPEHPDLPLLEIVTKGAPGLLRELPRIAPRIRQLAKSMEGNNPSDIISEMKLILGAGPGLTPLGDDILLGILLAVTRTKMQKYILGDAIRINHTVINAAKEKTTRVSWSLLSCAVQGTADERIIRVLDGLIAGREIPDQDLENLLDWGSSSGMAVLIGIVIALSSLPEL